MSEFDPEIMQDFLTESGELLEQLEGDLVQLESTPEDPELVNQTFRALHTIKGSGSFLALTNLVEIAHAAETALNAVRGGDASIDNDLMDMLLRSIDTLKVQFDELSAGSTELTKAELDLVEGLSKIGEGGDASASAPAGGDAPAGADDSAGRPLALDSSKMDLLEHFVADLDAQLEAFGTHIDELGDESTRSAAADNIADVLQELDATVDFFEFDAMLEITRAVGAAACNAPGLDGAMLEQLLPRLRATRVVLRRQRDGLAESRYFEPSMGSMIERIASLADGVMPDGAELPDGASDEDVLAHDGFDDGSDDGAPEGTIEDPSAAPAPVGDAGPADQGGPDPRQTGSRGAPAVEQTIRVEVGRLESLMNLVGELVLQKNRIGELAGQVVSSSDSDAELVENMETTSAALDRVTSDLQVAVMRTRMQPLDKLFGKYPRLIRDLAQKTGKQIQLEIEGGETEVDKSVIEELGDPLVHLMRNSADHGLEPPDEREAAGKGPQGTIKLRAGHEGNQVRIAIIDDGRGINREKVAAKAVERGLVTEAEASSMCDEEVYKMIFLPGFSTADGVSDLSGRGVGMDVVRTNIERIKGTITISSTPGQGSRIDILIPLTVAIMPAMMVRVAGETYAIPLGNITEIVRPDSTQLSTIIESKVIRLRDQVLPLADAQELLNVPFDEREESHLAVILTNHDKAVGMLVSGVLGQQEIVIKPLEGVDHSGPVSGATVRNDGGVSLIMDVTKIINRSE